MKVVEVQGFVLVQKLVHTFGVGGSDFGLRTSVGRIPVVLEGLVKSCYTGNGLRNIHS